MTKSIWKKEISRKKFLKTSGFVAASAAVLTACNGLDQPRYINNDVRNSQIKQDHRNYKYTYTKENVEKIPTTCYMCAVNCTAIGVVDKDTGIAKRMEPQPNCPVSGGGLCPRGNAAIAQLYDEDRLKAPMRKVGEYEWEEISWDEALDTIHDELTKIKDTYGPEAFMGLNRRGYYNGYVNAFLKAYGTPNGLLGQNSICDGGKRVAQQIVAGSQSLYCDYKNSKYIILMGANQMEAPRYRLAMPNDILEAQANGAKLVVIDPRFNYSAAKADEYHYIKPGTDGLMLMSMAHVVIRDGLTDPDFISKHSIGFDAYSKEVSKDEYAPANVADKVGIAADVIERLAKEFAQAQGGIIDSSAGIAMSKNGTNGHWQLLNLVAMTGNMLAEGGILKKASAKTKGPKWEEDNRTAKGFFKEAGWVGYSDSPEGGNRNIIPDVILNPEAVPTGPLLEEETVSIYDGKGIKAVLVYQTDPIGAQANSERMKEAFRALDFGVVVDIYLNQTCEALPIGGIALPECTYLERYAARTLNSYTPAIGLNQAIVEPMWDSKSMYWIIINLAKRFGFKDFQNLDPEKEYEAMKDSVMNAEQSNDAIINWDELAKTGLWMEKDPGARPYNNYEKTFNNEKYYFAFTDNITEDQEVYLKASKSEVPLFIEPIETTNDFPLNFMSGGKVIWHTQTCTRNNKYLMQIFDDNVIVKDTNYVVVSPEDAAARGIIDGEDATITTPIGSVTAPALVSNRVPKGYVHMTHGFGHDAPTETLANGVGANSAAIVDNLRLDPYSNCFTCKGEICQVSKA